MMIKKSELIIVSIIVSSTLFLYLSYVILTNLNVLDWIPDDYKWTLNGLLNIIGYSTVVVPGFIIYKYVNKTNYLSKSGRGIMGGIVRTCFGDEETFSLNQPRYEGATSRTITQEVFLWLFYFFGLQISFLTWGVLQEKVMTQKYTNSKGENSYFDNSQFLVFVNRILAFITSGLLIIYRRQHRHRCPLYKYSFCSLSNIMSSWCQYEALKYVSFPYQVLAKATKTIPVMVMGGVVSKTKYEFNEYVTAIILSIGMLTFMANTTNDRATSTVTTLSGVILLCMYIIFDSFTSNWQGALFKKYNLKPIQMMCFVNFYSCILTGVSLIQQGTMFSSIAFMFSYPTLILDCVILSVCSAVGQLFIFGTIATFGPLVFAIITTIRQGFSVLLSCLIYHHEISTLAAFGLSLVLFSMFLRAYCSYRLKIIRRSQNKSTVRATNF